jgi:hypothetical protein
VAQDNLLRRHSYPPDRWTAVSQVTQDLCGAGHRRTGRFERHWDQEQEVSMTLTILDPRSGQTVTLRVDDVPAVRQPAPAKVAAPPRLVAGRS